MITKQRKWTTEELELLRAEWTKLRLECTARDTAKIIGRKLDRSFHSVIGKARYLGLEN